MALNNQALFIISISFLLLSFSAEAYYQDDFLSAPSTAPVPSGPDSSPAPVSYISSTPDASPASSPGPSPATSPASSPLSSPSSVPLDTQSQVTKFIEKNMIGTMHKTEEFMGIIKKRFSDASASSIAGECLQQCQEVYDAAIDDIKNTLDDISSGDYYKASVDLSAVSTDVDTCEECFNEMIGEDPELKKFDDWVRGVTGDCLGALAKFNS